MKLSLLLSLAALAILPLEACAKQEKVLNLVPYPQEVVINSGSFKVAGAAFNCDPSVDARSQEAIRKFTVRLSQTSGKISTFTTPVGLAASADAGKIKGFVFTKDNSLASGEYSIEVGSKAVRVKTSDFYGTLYAIETLKQLMPVAVYGSKADESANWHIPCVSIKDAPRFGYRGMHMDCSRHFWSVDEVKKYIDVMAMYKLNRLHWHLTDDQGWRIELKNYPELALIGGFRDGTMIGKDFDSNDGKRYGGYYTQEQIKDIIKYADERGITIIPEVDLPGHMLAALAAYPQLGCTGGPYKVWHRWGISDEVLCPGKPATFEFLKGVLSEIADLFPGEYFHIGGDECPKVEWEKCPDCQKLIAELGLKDDDNASAEQYLQNYVMTFCQKVLEEKGKKVIGWDEILEGDLEEGAIVMSWRGTAGGIKAARMGYDVIMTPNSYYYLDYYQSKDTENEPLAIGGYLPVEKCYSFDPYESIAPELQHHILGVQANLWTEYIPSNEQLEYMLLPRMLALCEVQWCKPENCNYERFKTAVVDHQFKILDLLGYNYCRAIVEHPDQPEK